MSIIDKLRGRRDPARVASGTGDAGKLRLDQLGSWYLKQAMEFEQSKVNQANASRKLAWRCVGGTAVLQAITAITCGVVVLTNKPNPPGILLVNNETGEIRQLRTLADAKIKLTRATDLFNLRRYVGFRESYDWETIQDLFNATVLLSSPEEVTIYRAQNTETNRFSPVKIFSDKVRVIATAGTVSFVGNTALVSFSKKYIPSNGDKPTTVYCQAAIAYKYEDMPMDDRDRGVNPAGFKVTSYHGVRDITKTSMMLPAPGSYLGPTSCNGSEQ
ncbi:virB8 family protein [Massilia sp. LXY-6]|uniref:virB8 family protein n=1 Tax=Massilia sp. LXY-6 TaxID=3379823 RepID=UPI003EE1DC39